MMNAHDFGQGAQSKKEQKGQSQRQLRVGEELRHALSDVLMRGECRHPDLIDASVTVSEVRVSPDMRNATAFVAPLAGSKKDVIMAALIASAGELRHLVGRKVILRSTPRMHFKLDESFENAFRIQQLLNQATGKVEGAEAE